MDQVLNKCLIPTDEMINKLIDIELGFINTNCVKSIKYNICFKL